ncbi:hypothetical protein FACS189487_08940 [Campylobacterota bacterium]|nr:hypothetical protein FACS189487_08940 [Campylobacterota bacterium]
MGKCFEKLDFANFWDEDKYSLKEYTGEPLTKSAIECAEKELGYKLPASYIELLENKNGGIPKNNRFPTSVPTSWAKDHIAITGILGITDKDHSIVGDYATKFMIEEWGYPEIGIIICDCPSAGHDSIMLDYRDCGKEGEPQVVHVDVEMNDESTITFLAKDFETFIRGLMR